MARRKKIYEGKAKILYEGTEPGTYVQYFKDDTSAGDGAKKAQIEGKGGVHHIWACDHYKTTLNASRFKREYNRRTNMVKEAMDAAAGTTREELVDAIEGAVRAGGLFSVNVDIIHSQIGQSAHVILPAVESGEMNDNRAELFDRRPQLRHHW